MGEKHKMSQREHLVLFSWDVGESKARVRHGHQKQGEVGLMDVRFCSMCLFYLALPNTILGGNYMHIFQIF